MAYRSFRRDFDDTVTALAYGTWGVIGAAVLVALIYFANFPPTLH